MKTAVFPGSFDPFTLGHDSVVRMALPLFDEIIVAIGTNTSKSALFDLNRRMEWIKTHFIDVPSVKVADFEGLTVDFCRAHNAEFILRGLRTSKDFIYESSIAQMNRSLNGEITTIFVLCDPQFAAINASIVREIYINGGDVSKFLPQSVRLND